MKGIDDKLYSTMLEAIQKNPALLKKLQSEITAVAEPSLYQKNSLSDFTKEDNRRIAVLVLDWIYANKAYPREIIADMLTGHIGFKNQSGEILSKTKELEERLDAIFGGGDGSTGNDIIVKIEDIISTTLGGALTELINHINSNPMKWNVRCATTSELPELRGLITVDGHTLLEGDRILVKNQADKRTNGIYIASAQEWTKPPEFDSVADVKRGCNVIVESGDINFKSFWMLLPFSETNPEYSFFRVNRFLKANPDSSIAIDTKKETIALRQKFETDENLAGLVKVNKEGLVTEVKRYDSVKIIENSIEEIDLTGVEQEQFIGIDFSDGTRIKGSEWGISFKRGDR